jgi:protoporphyrinogen oxidase
VRAAAAGLRYRDFVTVALVVRGEDLFPDNWIYVHDPDVRVGRIQNFRAWSEAMVPDAARTCVGMEYFCFEGDELWSGSDLELVARATRELDAIGLADARRVEGGHVVRVPKAYPIYDADYEARVTTIRGWLAGIANLQQIGRNGLHRYNNSDHSMLTALRAVENALAGGSHDVWAVNSDGEYHEEARPLVQPYRDAPATPALLADEPSVTEQATERTLHSP